MGDEERTGTVANAKDRMLDPKVDLVFKALFATERNRDLLLSLLNGVLGLLGEPPVVQLEILTPFSAVDVAEDKVSTVDLAVQDERGHQYIVEMQCQYQPPFPQRILYYGARRFGDQLRSGEGYETLRPVLVVAFTNYRLLRQETDYVHRFELRGVNRVGRVTETVLTKHLRIVTVELPKFVVSEDSGATPAPGEQWIRFLKEGGADMQAATTPPPWETPELRRAREELARLAADPAMRELYERRLRQTQLLATELSAAFDEGREKGREDGQLLALRSSVSELIAFRFADQAGSLGERVQVAGVDALEEAQRALWKGASLEEVQAMLDRPRSQH